MGDCHILSWGYVLRGGRHQTVAGDFNCIIEKGDQEEGVGGGQLDNSGKLLSRLVREEGLRDVCRGKGFYKGGARGSRVSRIDFVFISEGEGGCG